ncbi:MAG: queuosine precursor transporter [Bryobacteraceae bacterium]|nr:queuosine precursor transporter [Bryobacteraceae bacterium]MDW8379895.1 queuosine precursor transporter [Bryobacterales bacterium]
MSSPQTAVPRFKYLDSLINIFVVVLIISNLVAPKLVAVGPLRLSGAQILFPVTYIFGDIFTEVYGYAASRRAIWTGFLASSLLAVMGLIIVALPPAPEWKDQKAFEVVFGFVPRVVISSLIAYWCGEFANAFVMARLKVITSGKMLWLRTIGSTAVGQLVDTTVVIVLAFAGTVGFKEILNLIFSGYFGKVLYEAAATPLTYVVVNGLKRAEGIDIYDTNTDFNPFRTGSSSPVRTEAVVSLGRSQRRTDRAGN